MLKATFPSKAFGFRRLAALICAVTAILFADFGVAFSSEENNLLGPSVDSVQIGRVAGLAYVDLPMAHPRELRIHVHGRALHQR